MKITVTGSLGNISKPLTETLIAAGHQVTVISSNAEKAAAIEALGAKAAIGSVEDVDFLSIAFAGADAVYTMVPPNMVATEWKKFIISIGHNYAEAISRSGVKNVVNLSSIGAHLAAGVGPVSGMHFVEEALNKLADVNVLHLRPGYFYVNFYHSAEFIKNMGIIGGNYGADAIEVLVAPADIAAEAARQLQALTFRGKSHLYVASSLHTGTEIAAILGKAVGKPELKWVEFKDEDIIGGMTGNGASADVAVNFAEMGAAMRTGIMFEDYDLNQPISPDKISLEEFAKVFAANI